VRGMRPPQVYTCSTAFAKSWSNQLAVRSDTRFQSSKPRFPYIHKQPDGTEPPDSNNYHHLGIAQSNARMGNTHLMRNFRNCSNRCNKGYICPNLVFMTHCKFLLLDHSFVPLGSLSLYKNRLLRYKQGSRQNRHYHRPHS